MRNYSVLWSHYAHTHNMTNPTRGMQRLGAIGLVCSCEVRITRSIKAGLLTHGFQARVHVLTICSTDIPKSKSLACLRLGAGAAPDFADRLPRFRLFVALCGEISTQSESTSLAASSGMSGPAAAASSLRVNAAESLSLTPMDSCHELPSECRSVWPSECWSVLSELVVDGSCGWAGQT